MKIAIATDFLQKFGGAQRVLLAIHELYSEAPIYCLSYDEEGTKGKFKDCKIIESSLNKWPKSFRKKIKYFLPVLPKKIEEFDFSDYDLVISSSDSFSHGIITKPSTFHLCYCHTPMRYAWDWYYEYLKENNIDKGLKSLIVRNILHKIRIWDKVAAYRVDKWLANSKNVQARIKKYYGADAQIIYPPVDVESFALSENEPKDYYLIISRLEPYKKIDLAIKACELLNKKLFIIGEGSQLDALKKIAGKNVSFLGWQDDKKMRDYLKDAKALIFPGEEDFGLTPVEAMAAGRPVIAYKRGGVIESIIDGKTGFFFDKPTADSLADAITKFEQSNSQNSSQDCRAQSLRFSKDIFQKEIKKAVNDGYLDYIKRFK
jgi:glycosyltransferase involved in cell wall biosynthesis